MPHGTAATGWNHQTQAPVAPCYPAYGAVGRLSRPAMAFQSRASADHMLWGIAMGKFSGFFAGLRTVAKLHLVVRTVKG